MDLSKDQGSIYRQNQTLATPHETSRNPERSNGCRGGEREAAGSRKGTGGPGGFWGSVGAERGGGEELGGRAVNEPENATWCRPEKLGPGADGPIPPHR